MLGLLEAPYIFILGRKGVAHTNMDQKSPNTDTFHAVLLIMITIMA